MKYVMEMRQKKNSVKNVIMLRLESDKPFPLYPKGTSFELNGLDYMVEDTVVCYHVDNSGEEQVRELVHKVLLVHQ